MRALTGDDDDAKALLKRCIFVEVRDHLINLELRKVYKETRCSKGRQLREMANQMRSEGVNELTRQLGVWRQPMETKRREAFPASAHLPPESLHGALHSGQRHENV